MTAKGKGIVPAEPVDVDMLPVCTAPGCKVIGRPGEILCDGHSAEQRVLSARLKIAGGAMAAAETIIDLSQNAQREETRLKASEAVLDRAGLRPGVEIEIVPSSNGGPTPADILRERLATLRVRTIGPGSGDAATEPDVGRVL